MSKLSKRISFNIAAKDKKNIQAKAQELGISLARLCRNIILDKYQALHIGYFSKSSLPMKQDIDIRRLKPPQSPMKLTKEKLSMKECINELKEVFTKGLNVLGKMDNSELGIKSEKELEDSKIKAEIKMIERFEKEQLENVSVEQ